MKSPPTSVQKAAAAAAAHKFGASKGSRRDVVLIAEDMKMLRRMLQRHFERLGCEVLVAENGAGAVELFREHGQRIDCVFMDQHMPVMGGNDATEAIRRVERRLPNHVPVPILRLSSDQSPADIQASNDAGMTRMLAPLRKGPYDYKQLTQSLILYSLHGRRAALLAQLKYRVASMLAQMGRFSRSYNRSEAARRSLRPVSSAHNVFRAHQSGARALERSASMPNFFDGQ